MIITVITNHVIVIIIIITIIIAVKFRMIGKIDGK